MQGTSSSVRFIRPALRVALAHHPLCHHFRDDVFEIVGLRLCRGCVLLLPMLVLGMLCASVLAHVGVPWQWVATGALALGAPQLGTYLHRMPGIARAAVKLSGGLGLGLLLATILIASLPWFWRLTMLGLLAMVFVALQTVRAYQILGTCRSCPWNMDWDHCPGFGGL